MVGAILVALEPDEKREDVTYEERETQRERDTQRDRERERDKHTQI